MVDFPINVQAFPCHVYMAEIRLIINCTSFFLPVCERCFTISFFALDAICSFFSLFNFEQTCYDVNLPQKVVLDFPFLHVSHSFQSDVFAENVLLVQSQ